MRSESRFAEHSMSQEQKLLIGRGINGLFNADLQTLGDEKQIQTAQSIVSALDPLLNTMNFWRIKSGAEKYIVESYIIIKKKKGNYTQMEFIRLMPINIAETDGEKDPKILIITYNPQSKEVKGIGYKS